MTKTLPAFVAGSMLTGSVVFIAHPAPAAFGFASGILTAVVATAALIGSAPRARRVARFLEIVADGLSGTKTTIIRSIAPAEKMPSPIELDVTSALRNFGMSKKAAAQLAREIVEANPAADLNAALEIAMKASRKAAA